MLTGCAFCRSTWCGRRDYGPAPDRGDCVAAPLTGTEGPPNRRAEGSFWGDSSQAGQWGTASAFEMTFSLARPGRAYKVTSRKLKWDNRGVPRTKSCTTQPLLA